jgi:hypothetical protein
MFYISGFTGPCRCGCQQRGRRRQVTVFKRTGINGSTTIRSKCTASVHLWLAGRDALRRGSACASVGIALGYRVDSAVQDALSTPTPLPLRTRSFVRRLSVRYTQALQHSKQIFRVKYLVPGNAGQTPDCVRLSDICSDVEGRGPQNTWLLRNFT